MSYTRDTTNDLVWDEESGTYINAYNPTVRELEANGVVYDIISKGVMNNNNATPLKMWSGTRAEYNAIETKDANTLYNITDDTFSISLLERIWPVGSIYIGTMSTCPLAAIFGTWTLVETKLLVDINDTIPVHGNGNTLGLTDGATNAGLTQIVQGGLTTSTAITQAYGQPVGTYTGNTAIAGPKNIGVTTDPAKSGIIANLSSSKTSLTTNIWRRIA